MRKQQAEMDSKYSTVNFRLSFLWMGLKTPVEWPNYVISEVTAFVKMSTLNTLRSFSGNNWRQNEAKKQATNSSMSWVSQPLLPF